MNWMDELNAWMEESPGRSWILYVLWGGAENMERRYRVVVHHFPVWCEGRGTTSEEAARLALENFKPREGATNWEEPDYTKDRTVRVYLDE
jgi:hypothetical protein